MTTTAYFLACDDIRQEVTGKRILVGVYGSSIVVSAFPANLRKLYLRVHVRSPIEDRHEIRSVRVERPGLSDFEKPFPDSEPTPSPQPTPPPEKSKFEDEGVVYFDSVMLFDIGPMELPEPGRIRVFVETEKEEIYAGSIKVMMPARNAGYLEPRDVGTALASLNLFAHARKMGNSFAAKLGRDLLDVLSMSSIASLPPPTEKMVPFRIGPNEFRIIFFDADIYKKPFYVSDFPDHYRYETLDKNETGITIRFSPAEPEVPNFRFDIDE
jgi:hypothetical protein